MANACWSPITPPGIGAVDLQTKAVALLAHPPELSLGGIDGLYLAGGTLLAVQNGTAPPRILQMPPGAEFRAPEIRVMRIPG
jgi:hypothetical protein